MARGQVSLFEHEERISRLAESSVTDDVIRLSVSEGTSRVTYCTFSQRIQERDRQGVPYSSSDRRYTRSIPPFSSKVDRCRGNSSHSFQVDSSSRFLHRSPARAGGGLNVSRRCRSAQARIFRQVNGGLLGTYPRLRGTKPESPAVRGAMDFVRFRLMSQSETGCSGEFLTSLHLASNPAAAMDMDLPAHRGRRAPSGGGEQWSSPCLQSSRGMHFSPGYLLLLRTWCPGDSRDWICPDRDSERRSYRVWGNPVRW